MPGNETLCYRVMRLLEATPQISQREIARELGISVGSTNNCLRTLVVRGWLKPCRVETGRNRAAYRYLLTPRGVKAKASQTIEVLREKTREYEALRSEIRQMRREARKSAT